MLNNSGWNQKRTIYHLIHVLYMCAYLFTIIETALKLYAKDYGVVSVKV